MAKTLTISEVESLSSIFKPIMDAHQLKVSDIKGSGEIDIFDIGMFECKECNNTWRSYFSWVTMSLLEQKIVYRWKMKCKYCTEPYEPTFSMEQFKDMIKKAVLIYTKEYVSRNPRRRAGQYATRQAPHKPTLCEKCRYCPYSPCWIKYV